MRNIRIPQVFTLIPKYLYFTNVVKKSEIGKDIGFYFRNNNFIGIYNKKAITEVIASCDSAAIRTQDPRLRRALLYPAELRNHP